MWNVCDDVGGCRMVVLFPDVRFKRLPANAAQLQRASASCINAATECILKTGETGAHRRNPLLFKHCSTPELPPPPLSRFLSIRLSVPPLIRLNADAKFNVRHQILMASEE